MSQAADKMTFFSHVGELKSRLFKAALAWLLLSAAALFNSSYVWQFVLQPLIKSQNVKIVNIAPTEALIIDFKISLLVGALVASPVIFWQCYSFLAPALYKNEKRTLIPAVFFSVLLFFSGALFALYVVLPASIAFLSTYGSGVAVQTWTQASYSGFLIQMTMAFALLFQMPVVTSFLAKLNVLTASFMVSQIRVAILIIFIVAAMLTPPDVISMLLLAAPILGLYFISIVLAWIFNRPAGEVHA